MQLLYPASFRQQHLAVVVTIAGYLAITAALSIASQYFETLSIVSIWYPSVALSVVLVMALGALALPALMLANLISLILIYQLPASGPIFGIALAQTAIYGGVGIALRIRFSRHQHSILQQTGFFLFLTLVAPLLVGLTASGLLLVAGVIQPANYIQAALNWALGDAMGLVIIAPPLILYLLPFLDATARVRGRELWTAPPSSWYEKIAFAASVPFVLWIVFVSPLAPERPFYLCLLPIVWIGIGHGLSRTTLGILAMNIGALILVPLVSFPADELIDLQLLMLAVAINGLLLGSVVSDKFRQEQQLRADELRARAIVQDQTELVCRYQGDTRLTFVNEAYCRFFGLRREELIGESFLRLSRTEYHAIIRQQIATILATGEPLVDESLIMRNDGELRWLQWINRRVSDERTGMLEVQVVGRDVTDRRRAEEAYRSLVDQSLQGLAMIQGERLIFVNPAFCQMLGRSEQELLSLKAIWSVIHPDDVPELRPGSEQRNLSEWLGRSLDIRVFRSDGEQRWLEIFLGETRSDDRVAVLVLAIDITGRKLAEAQLQRNEDRYRIISQLTSDYSSAWLVNPDLTTTREWNTGPFEQITGYSIEEFDARGSWRSIVHPDDDALLVDQYYRSLGGETTEEQLRIIHKQGHVVWLRISIRPEFDPASGRAVRGYSAVRDITAQKQIEDMQRMVDRRLQEAQRLESIGLLAGGIAHDFNNLLVSVIGNAELLKLVHPQEGESREAIRQIEVAVRHGADLIRQLLSYAGKGQTVMHRLNISKLIGEMIRLLRIGIPRTIELVQHAEPGTLDVEGDATQLRQVVMNIVLNAADAIGEQGGIITVTARHVLLTATDLIDSYYGSELHEGYYVQIELTDTGSGMSEATLARIFEPFYTTKVNGRGLGLAAVLGIIRSHQGAMKIQSVVGRGTTFQLLLPALTNMLPEAVAAHEEGTGL